MNYEIHITVALDPHTEEEVERFKRNAERMGVKGIVLNAFPLLEVMTSCRWQGEQNEAFREMTRQVMILTGWGYHIVRSKVETELAHPAALTPLPNQYFEAHINVLLDEHDIRNLRGLQEGIDFYLSQNLGKPRIGNKDIHIITIREYHTFPDKFAARIEAFCGILRSEGFEVTESVENEFALYDSNPERDKPWFLYKGNPCTL